MSREAAEDGRPDVAEGIELAAMTSESAESGEARVTGEGSEPLYSDGATVPGEHGNGAKDDKGDEGGPVSLIELAEPAGLDEQAEPDEQHEAEREQQPGPVTRRSPSSVRSPTASRGR